MANSSHVQKFLEGAKAWNAWRAAEPNEQPDLSDTDFESVGPEPYDIMHLRDYDGYDLSDCDLNRISARNLTFVRCSFARASMSFSDFCFSFFSDCDFSRAEMRVSKMGSASFARCRFDVADLSYCTAEEAEFQACVFDGTKLNHVSLVKTKFPDTELNAVCVYGASVWDVDLTGAKQSDIFIREEGVGISVPSIELAQFVALLLDNRKVRDFIDTMTSKMVLILGRFSPERKVLLDRLKAELTELAYLPVIFDFAEPESRDVRETVKTLASLSRFVIADLTDPKSIPLELEAIVPQFPSLPVQPIIMVGQKPFSMFNSLTKFPSVLPIIEYGQEVKPAVLQSLIVQCESKLLK